MKKYLIVTGGSKGIGFATAKLFYEKDYQVINISRNPCNLDKVINIEVNLLEKGWEKTVSEVLENEIKEKSLISLVHNSALLEKDSIVNIDADIFRKVMELNVIVPSILNKLVLDFLNPKSSIIYIGSTLSEKAVSNTASYVTSKHALVGLMRATCQDLVGTGIHTACVCPGFTDTEMLRSHIGDNDEIVKSLESIICAGRLIQPEEIAKVIHFCAENPVINGSIIHANLGNIER